MLKIAIHDSAAECRFVLRGELSGAAVNELEMCWRTASSTTAGRRTAIDLRGVAASDDAGENLLAEMSREGVEVIRPARAAKRPRSTPMWMRLCCLFTAEPRA